MATRCKLTKNAITWFKTTTTNENARNRQRILKVLPHPLRNPLRIGTNTTKTTKPIRYPSPTIRPSEDRWKVLVNDYAIHSTSPPPHILPSIPSPVPFKKTAESPPVTHTMQAPMTRTIRADTHPPSPLTLDTRKKTYRFRESILKRRVVLRTSYFFPLILSLSN